MTRNDLRFVGLLSAGVLAGSLALAGCGDSGVSARAARIDHTSQAVTAADGTPLELYGLTGAYEGPACKEGGGAFWRMYFNSDNPMKLVVNERFADCHLVLYQAWVRYGAGPQPLYRDFPLAPPIVLGLDYAQAASAVNDPDAAKLAFYANARITGLNEPAFSGDFAIEMVYSDDAMRCGDSAPPAVYATVGASGAATAVAPPNYTLAFDSFQLKVDVNKVVQASSTGSVVLTPGNPEQLGEEYRVFDRTDLCCSTFSFGELDNYYLTGTPVASGNIIGSTPVTLPWTSFDLQGKAVPATRDILVKHTGAGGVHSYQLVAVVFPGPLY